MTHIWGNSLRTLKILMILLVTALPAACKEESKSDSVTCRCAHPAAGLHSVARAEQSWSLSGSLKLTPPPKDRISGRVMLLIDEQHVFSEQRHRLIEKEIVVSYEDIYGPEALGECGESGDYSDYDYEYSHNYESCECGSSFAMRDEATVYEDDYDYSYGYEKIGIRAAARGSADSINLINLEIDFAMPDKRSTYFAGIHIDADGDGTISDGDYITREFAEIDPTGRQGIQLVAELIETEKTLTSGRLDLQTLAPPSEGATMQVILYDISVPQLPKKVASLTRQDAADLSFALSAVPETETTIWQLTAWIDTNQDGKLDACDYVEAQKTVPYSLLKLHDLIIPMAYAGGTAATCAPIGEEEDEEEGDSGEDSDGGDSSDAG